MEVCHGGSGSMNKLETTKMESSDMDRGISAVQIQIALHLTTCDYCKKLMDYYISSK